MQPKVTEIFLMRAFACSSVVLLHSIAIIQQVYNLSPITQDLFRTMQLLLLYATPMFVFISEFILSYSYTLGLPKGFFAKRFKYIIVPYIFFGLFYAVLWSYSFSINNIAAILKQIFLYIFRGDYHGYFVLIIFQFYILHKLFCSILNKFNKKSVFILSFIFNIMYLMFFNYTIWCDYAYIPFAKYIWTRGYFMILPAWIFYFVFAYYAGQNIDRFSYIIKKYIWLFVFLTICCSFIILFQYKYHLLTVISTKRPDIVPYTLFIILTIFYVASSIHKIPKGVDIINQCSYSIYLIHPFVQHILHNLLLKTNFFKNPYISLLFVFLISLYVPAFIAILINKWSYGYLLVGKLGPSAIPKNQLRVSLMKNMYLPYIKNIKNSLCKKHSKQSNTKPVSKDSLYMHK